MKGTKITLIKSENESRNASFVSTFVWDDDRISDLRAEAEMLRGVARRAQIHAQSAEHDLYLERKRQGKIQISKEQNIPMEELR